MFRLYALTFKGKFRGTEEQAHHLHESPAAITVPLIVLAVLAALGGLVNIPEIFMEGGNRLEHFLAPIFEPSYQLMAHHTHHLSHSTEYLLMGISVGGALIAIVIAWNTFSKYEKTDKQQSGLGKFFENKWYIDELYDRIIVQPVLQLARVLNNFVEKKIIDGIVNGVGRSVNYGSRQIRLLQNGQVSLYVLLMVIGLLLMFIIQFLSK